MQGLLLGFRKSLNAFTYVANDSHLGTLAEADGEAGRQAVEDEHVGGDDFAVDLDSLFVELAVGLGGAGGEAESDE